MIRIESLDEISIDVLFIAFSEAFKTYEMQWDKEAFKKMLQRRGYVSQLSFGAFDKEKLVSFTLNGIGSYQGIKTAYDTGTGTIDSYRGKGLASRIFETSLPHLKDAGLSRYVLEVLQHNAKAVSIYRKLNFKVSREFNYFKGSNSQVKIAAKKLPDTLSIRDIKLDDIRDAHLFWDVSPSWQNSFESIYRCHDDFKVFGVFQEYKLIGYGVFEPSSGDVSQVAVDKKFRRQGVGSYLLKEMIEINKSDSIKVINSEITCTSMYYFLEACGISLMGKQYEMFKRI